MLYENWPRNMWVSVGQLAAKLQSVKVGGLKRILPLGLNRATLGQPGVDSLTTGSSSNFDSFDPLFTT